jgi:hypothetical protein
MTRKPPKPGHLLLTAAFGLVALGGCERAGSDLGELRELTSPAGAGSAQPNLTVDARGRAHLSWIEPVGEGSDRLVFAVHDGDGWSDPMPIAQGDDWFVNWADFPAMTALPDGRLAAHYLERHPQGERGYHYGIRLVQSADGGKSWSAPVQPHRAEVPAEYGFVSLFPAAADSVGVVWLDGRMYDESMGGTEEMSLRFTTVGPDGGLGEEVVLDSRVCDCCQTSVALTDEGAIAVYRDRSPGEVRDISVTRQRDGGWTAGKSVHDDGWVIPACPVNGPAVAAEGGRVAVAWFTAADDEPRVLIAFSGDGGESFGQAIRVDDGDPLGRADVVILPGGDAVVAWLEATVAGQADVRLRRVTPEGALGEPVTAAMTSGSRSSGFPRMVSAAGRIVLAWTDTAAPTRVRVAELEVR